MKSNCFQKFVNTFTNEDENHILNELYSDRVNDRDEIMTIRKLQIDNIDQSTIPFNSIEENSNLEKQANALIIISVEDLTQDKEDDKIENENQQVDEKDDDKENLEQIKNLNPENHNNTQIAAYESDNISQCKIENFIQTNQDQYVIESDEGSPRILQEKKNQNIFTRHKEIIDESLHTEKVTYRNSASTRPSHRKNFSMIINEKTINDPDLEWRGKDRSMSQTVDLKEPKSFLINNIKYLYDSSTNRSKMRVSQMRKMQVSRGSISSGIDIDDLIEDSENKENISENKMHNLISIKLGLETTSLHIKNKTIDMNSPDFKLENVKTASNATNSNDSKNKIINSASNNEMEEKVSNKRIFLIKDQSVAEKVDPIPCVNTNKFNKKITPSLLSTTHDLIHVDSERTINANLSTAPHLTTPILTNENLPISTKNQTSAYQEDTEVVISDLEGSIENKGDETNDDNLFSLSCSYPHKSFIPITNSLKSKKDLKEENATPSYLLALSEYMNNPVEDDSDNNKLLMDISKSTYNLMPYENLDSLENESLKSSQNRNRNNMYKSMKEVKHFRLPSGKNYFINSVIEEEFSEICSESELSFKKHSYLFSKGKLDVSSDKKFSLQSSKDFQVEKNLENVFFEKMRNTHSNSKSEIPSELNNNIKNAIDLNFNTNFDINKQQIEENKKEKNQIFNVHMDLKKNYDEIKKKITEEEDRTKAKVESKKKEILDLFFNKTKNATVTNSNQFEQDKNNNSKIDKVNLKKTANKIMININKIDLNNLSARSPSPPIKGKKSPSSKCREECYQDNSDRSKKHKRIQDINTEILPKLSKEDFDMKIISPIKKEIDEPNELIEKEQNLNSNLNSIRQNYIDNYDRKPNSISNISGLSHKALKEIYKRQREQKSKNSSIFKSEDLRISKPDGITIQQAQNDSNKKNNINTFNSINEQFSFININNNINICTPLSMKNDIVEYGVATERANDKIYNNQFDMMKNNISMNNELCQASPISYMNNNSNRKSINLNLNFSSKKKNANEENIQDVNNSQKNVLKRILFENDSGIIKNNNYVNLGNVENKKYKDEISVSNEITINILNQKQKFEEKKDLKEILENVKIDNLASKDSHQNNDDKISCALTKSDLQQMPKDMPNHKIEKKEILEKNNNNNEINITRNEMIKVNLINVLKKDPPVQHKKNVSLNPKAFMNQEYKLNNLLINNNNLNTNSINNNETKKIKSTSIGKNSNKNNSITNKHDTVAYSSQNSNTTTHSIKQHENVSDKENKHNSSHATVNPENNNSKLSTKNNFINHYTKNKTRSCSDSSVKFNHINDLLTKQHSSLLQIPNPTLMNFNQLLNTKKLDKKSYPQSMNTNYNLDSHKMVPPIKSSSINNNRNLSHDMKSNNTLTLNNNNTIAKKKENKKLSLNANNKNVNSSNNSNVESFYPSVGNKLNPTLTTYVEKPKNISTNAKTQCTVIPIPKIPNSKKTIGFKTLQSNNSGNDLIMNHEEMFRIYDKIKNLNMDKHPSNRNNSKSKWK